MKFEIHVTKYSSRAKKYNMIKVYATPIITYSTIFSALANTK